MDETELLSRLAVALAIGLLVGLERGWQTREEEAHQRAAGFRTFAISGLLGGVAAAISGSANTTLLGLVFLGYAIAFTAFHWLEARATKNLSVTSVIAGLLTFALGAYAVLGELPVAIAAAVALTLLLALREPLHRWVASLTWEEIRAVLILLAMTFLLLPILPNRTIDPWQALNPHEIWLLAVLIAAISFAGYVAVRLFGNRLGLIVAALAGGLASSTATTLTLARLGRERAGSARLIAGGILIAGIVMVVRVGVVASLLNPALLPHLALPLAAGAVVLAAAAALFLFQNAAKEEPNLQPSNPLQLGTAIKLAAFIAVVTLATKLLGGVAGGAGALVVAALSGIADVDAVTISMARLGVGGIGLNTAIQAILIAVGVNTAAKAVMAGWVGGLRIGTYVGIASLLAIAAGFGASVIEH
jgi:uncharacterized membrane protein (DUF4010 family)